MEEGDKSLVLFFVFYDSIVPKLLIDERSSDKQMKNKKEEKIKVVISGKERSFEETWPVHDWKNSKKETAASKEEKDEEHFEWVLPEVDETQVKNLTKINYVDQEEEKSKKKRFHLPGLSGFFLASIGAIALGILFGFIILKMVSPSDYIAQDREAEQVSATTGEKKSKQTSLDVEVAPVSFGLIQAGVFTNSEAAEEMVKKIEKKDIPANIIAMEGKSYVFIGAANNLTKAKALGASLQAEGLNIYAKEFTSSAKNITATSQEEKEYLEKASSLFQQTTELITIAYLEGKVDEKEVGALQQQIKQIEASGKIKNASLEKMQEKQLESYEALQLFSKNNDKQALVKAQNALLSFIKHYIELKE